MLNKTIIHTESKEGKKKKALHILHSFIFEAHIHLVTNYEAENMV
jgi:hypothetical protein